MARDLSESKTLGIRWLPNVHMIADCLTKAVIPNEIFVTIRDENVFSLVPTTLQELDEKHRLTLRQGQRMRAKARQLAARQTE